MEVPYNINIYMLVIISLFIYLKGFCYGFWWLRDYNFLNEMLGYNYSKLSLKYNSHENKDNLYCLINNSY